MRAPSTQAALIVAAGVAMFGAAGLRAQTPAPKAPAAKTTTPARSGAPADARSQAPFDATGDWVSLVTEDWRFRMVVPGRGEYSGIPINAKGKAFADGWNRAADEAAGQQCEAYGAGVIMLIPERLRISWQDDNTIQVRTDAGMQTRLLHFAPTAKDAAAPPSWQGYSVARWLFHKVYIPTTEDKPFEAIPAGPAPRLYGQLEVTTNRLLPGLLRKNGVRYGAGTHMTEYWELHGDPGSTEKLLIVTTELIDPEYLVTPYDYTAIFKAERESSKWSPTVCTLSQ